MTQHVFNNVEQRNVYGVISRNLQLLLTLRFGGFLFSKSKSALPAIPKDDTMNKTARTTQDL